MTPGSFFVEGDGAACLVPVPAIPSPQQREFPPALREELELVFVHPEGPPRDPVDTLERVRQAVGVERVGLLGTSIWGLLCAAYARRFPAHTAFVVLVGTPPQTAGLEDAQRAHWEDHASAELKALLDKRLQALDQSQTEETVASNARAWAPMGWFDPLHDPSEMLDGIEIDREQTNATVQTFASISLPVLLPQLECPVLRVHGTSDNIVPPPLWEKHGSMGNHVVTKTFERSGHHPPCEEPKRFVHELHEFLRDHIK